MIYHFCHCITLHVWPDDFFFILDSRLANYFGKKLSFWLSAYSVLIVVPSLYVRPSFPLVRKVLGNYIDS